MKYANNPQSFINGFYSSSRNVFLTVSVAIAMYGFSESFKIGVSKHVVKDLSLLILLFSFMLGLTNIIFFNKYIKVLEREDKEVLPLYVDLKLWKTYLYIKSYFVLLLGLLIAAGLVRLIRRRFKF